MIQICWGSKEQEVGGATAEGGGAMGGARVEGRSGVGGAIREEKVD